MEEVIKNYNRENAGYFGNDVSVGAILSTLSPNENSLIFGTADGHVYVS